jgi:ABC-2 type transport system permease protein
MYLLPKLGAPYQKILTKHEANKRIMKLRPGFSVILASSKTRLLTLSRYPGELLIDIITPIVFALIPILIGKASAGRGAETIFARNTGTENYISYMLIGSCIFSIVFFAFWNVAYWLRSEMETGTIEALYLSPSHRIWVAGGISLYSLIRSIFSAAIAYILGSFLFGVNPFQGNIVLALLFIIIGIIPLYGMTLIFGAMVLRVKQANTLVNLMQWIVSFLMGVFFPIAMLPAFLRVLALLFPPTWMNIGARASILGIEYFFTEWYLDLAVLWGFTIFAPLFGYWAFRSAENKIRSNEGVGTF